MGETINRIFCGRHRLSQIITICLLLPLFSGCWSAPDAEVVVYTALDREFCTQIFDDFTKKTGIVVQARFDTESTKTVGLAERIIQESDRPRCDLFWNNEILHTLRLERRRLLDVYRSPLAADYPQAYRSPNGTWCGFAARARILIVNTRVVPEDQRPDSIDDLGDPRWKGRLGIAKPLFGTTASHAACLFAVWGDEKAKAFFLRLKANGIKILSGNREVARRVATGELAFGLTDTDDAVVETDAGSPVVIIYPDSRSDQLGTLFIPNTLSVIRGAPHGKLAQQLVDYLLSSEVESRLARGPSAQIPLNRKVTTKPRVETPATVKAMQVDFAAAAEKWEQASEFIRDQFTTGE